MSVTSDERRALADLFDEVGPDAPTLCGTWTTRDLVAHLLVRERRPDAAGGILIPALSKRTEKVMADLVEQVGQGAALIACHAHRVLLMLVAGWIQSALPATSLG